MKASLRHAARAAGAAALVLLVATCGGGGSTGTGDQTEIDIDAAEVGAEELSLFMPVCHSGSSLMAPSLPKRPGGRNVAAVLKLLELTRAAALRAGGNPKSFLSPTKPGDQFGDCGGRVTFPSYSHSNGTTTATMEFDNFCSVNEDTGAHDIADGSMSMVDNGSPGTFGPVTTSLEADSPNGITLDAETTGGSTISSHRISFSDLLLDVGVPGGTATQSNPDRTSFDELRFTNLVTNKTYLQTDYLVTEYYTANGTEFSSLSGRGHRSNGDYFDIQTTTPMTTAPNGDFLGGVLSFTGANGSQAVLTLVPGSTRQATLTVNGTPVTNVPACQ